MSKCKKLITILLCGIMVFGMSLTAFAETPTSGSTDTSGGVANPTAPPNNQDPTPNPPQSNNINGNVMVGGTWQTPVANAGGLVNVVLPLVNMAELSVTDVIVTPVISGDPAVWPFEIEKSSYTETLPILPGEDCGLGPNERRQEITWTLKTRKDAVNGYQPVTFQVQFKNPDESAGSASLVTYVKVTGGTGANSAQGTGSVPRVIISGFTTNPENVRAGESFDLTLHIRNTSKSTVVSNCEFDIQTTEETTSSGGTGGTTTSVSAPAFLPTSGSSTIFVDKIAADSTKDVTINMTPRADLMQKPYAISVNMKYEDANAKEYTADASVSIPVKQEAKLDVSEPEVMPESVEVGQQTNIMFSIYNTGKTILYNVSVKFQGDSINGGEAYLGNISPGATGNVDTMVNGIQATMDEGIVKAVITYEDDAGNAATLEKDITLYVTEPMAMDPGMMDPGMMDPGMEEQGGGFNIWFVLGPVIALVVIGGIVAIVIIRKKKKERLEREGIEDEIAGLDQDEHQ
ncbi:COG1361 S-layer family protein [Diplocloster modestus]|uniref:CARDB domain-containing protein n=1 Tax=Diplocloster modestus TaxID=2850322 RepID=A0ABS6K5S0_9FIRM|nr:hypothetical protein [Diplocloster modestus]MBU9725848.1 hypothetical protein [Diplocloster modestus]